MAAVAATMMVLLKGLAALGWLPDQLMKLHDKRDTAARRLQGLREF